MSKIENVKQQRNNVPFLPSRWLGQRLCIVRETLGITPEQLAKFMKTSSHTITQVEQGQRLLPNGWLHKLTHFLEIDANWLLSEPMPNAKEKKSIYDEMVNLMQVPEVAEMINYQLKLSKITFKGQIKETIMKRKDKSETAQ